MLRVDGMRNVAIAIVAVTCFAQPARPDPRAPLTSAADEVVTLWRGDRNKPSTHIAAGSTVRWEHHCEHERPGAVFAITRRAGDDLQRKLDDTVVTQIGACDASAGCCELARGKRKASGVYLDAVCFDRDLHLVLVRETNEGACRG